MNTTSRESDKFMLRLPSGMRDRIRQTAEENGRSMNAEIVETLSKAYPDYGDYTDRLVVAMIAAMKIVEKHGLDPNSEEFADVIGQVTGKYMRHLDIPTGL